MKKTFVFRKNWCESRNTMNGPLREFVKAMNLDGHDLIATVAPLKKLDAVKAKYHAMIGEISAQIGGDLAAEEDAKRILISAFRIDTLRDMADEWGKFGDLRMGRGLRGEVVLMGVQSRDFGSKLSSAFVEWLYAFGTEQGCYFTETVTDPETGEIFKTTWQQAKARAEKQLEAA